MTKKLYEETNISDIASAIREKNGSSNQYTVAQMAGAVRAIRTSPSLEELNVVTNGDYVPSSGKDGFSSVHVAVPTGGADPVLQEKTATQNGIILPDTGYDGLSKVTVNVSGGDATGIVSPSYQGLSYCYVASNGTALWHENNLLQYINIFEVQASHTYILAVWLFSGARRRASFFPGRTYSQFEPYLFESASPAEVIFSDGVWLAPYVQNTDDSGRDLLGRIIYTPSTNGVIVYGTDNTGATCPAYCIDVYSSSGGTEIRFVTHSISGSDASIDVYVNQTLIRNILYTTVQHDLAHSFDDIYNIFIGYNVNTSAPDHRSRNGWCIYAPSNSSVILNGIIISPNSLIGSWAYDTSVSFTIEV